MTLSFRSVSNNPANWTTQNIHRAGLTSAFGSPSLNASNVAFELTIALVVCATPPKTTMMLKICTELPLIHCMKAIIAIELTLDCACAKARRTRSFDRSSSSARASDAADVPDAPAFDRSRASGAFARALAS